MRALASALVALLSAPALAAIYELPGRVTNQADIDAWESAGEIDENTAETLRDLLTDGVDLNGADRDTLYGLPGLSYRDVDAILEYRKTKGHIDDPVELVGANAITAEQLEEIGPFITVEEDLLKDFPLSAKFRLHSMFSPTDRAAPPGFFIAKVKAPYGLSAGVNLATLREWPGSLQYEPLTDSLQTNMPQYTLYAPRFWAQWKSGQRKVVVGTYYLGFGERLTIDNTRNPTPHGIYLVDQFSMHPDSSKQCKLSGDTFGDIDPACWSREPNYPIAYRFQDFTWREPFRGAAGGVEDLDLGTDMRMSMWGWISFQNHSLYQYQLFDHRTCDDPRDDSDACKTPSIFVKGSDGLPTTAKFIFETFPAVFNELLGGARVQFDPSYALRLGITGYGAATYFNSTGANGPRLDFQEWSRWPFNGPFGAIGIDGKYVIDDFDFAAELTRSFDGIPTKDSVNVGGGGFGFEQRTTYSPGKQLFELSLRYYDNRFANPYARPIAAPDLLDGQRARDEVGAQFKYSGKILGDFRLSARLNYWVLPFSSVPATPEQPSGNQGWHNLFGRVRVGFEGWKFFEPSVWVDVRNKNLASSTHGNCESGEAYIRQDGVLVACSGDSYRLSGRLEFWPLHPRSRLSISTEAHFAWADSVAYKDRFQNNFSAFVDVNWWALDWLYLHVKSRLLISDLGGSATTGVDPTAMILGADYTVHDEQSLWSFVEVGLVGSKNLKFELRYDNYAYIDRRPLTLRHTPNPEHRFGFDIKAGF